MLKIMAVLGVPFLLVGCFNWKYSSSIVGTGPVVARNYDLNNFKRVKVSGSFICDVAFGKSQSVQIYAQENVFPYLNVQSNGQRLKIGVTYGGGVKTDLPIKVKIIMVDPLDQINLSGAVSFNIHDARQESLRLRASGACNLDAQSCVIDDVDISLSGSCEAFIALNKLLHAKLMGASTLTYSGKAEHADISLSGSGTVNGEKALVKRMALKASGAADVQVHVSEKLDIDASGTASIIYAGNPIINQKGYGVVKIHQK